MAMVVPARSPQRLADFDQNVHRLGAGPTNRANVTGALLKVLVLIKIHLSVEMLLNLPCHISPRSQQNEWLSIRLWQVVYTTVKKARYTLNHFP